MVITLLTAEEAHVVLHSLYQASMSMCLVLVDGLYVLVDWEFHST